jgi:hypothetical protein
MIMKSDIKKQTLVKPANLGLPKTRERNPIAQWVMTSVMSVAFLVGMMAIFASTQVQATVYEYFAGTVTDQNGDPISDATVRINEVSDNTDSDGSFGFHVERDDQDRYIINVTKSGYALVSQIEHAPSVSLRFTLKKVEVFEIDPTQDSELEDSRGTRILVPANSLVDSEGQPVTDIVMLAIYTYDLANEAIPGDMGTTNGTYLESAGAFWGEFTDTSGKKLDLTSDEGMTVSIPAINDEKKVGLWFYDETEGTWIGDGSARLVNGRFEGQIKHFSAWNFDWEKTTPACVKLEIDQAFYDTYKDGAGVLQIKAVATLGAISVTRILSMNAANYAGPHALYNLPPGAIVEFFVPPPFLLPPYATVSTGAAWGGTGFPPYPYDVCNGSIAFPVAPLDHFKCYSVKGKKVNAKVDLEDQFGGAGWSKGSEASDAMQSSYKVA